MVEPRHIVPFFKEFNGQRWKNFNSEKVCAITYARIQVGPCSLSRALSVLGGDMTLVCSVWVRWDWSVLSLLGSVLWGGRLVSVLCG